LADVRVTPALSQYAGTGMYERTEGGTIPSYLRSVSTPSLGVSYFQTSSFIPRTDVSFKQPLVSKSVSSSKQIFDQGIILDQKVILEQKNIVVQKQIPVQKQALTLKQIFDFKRITTGVPRISPPRVPRGPGKPPTGLFPFKTKLKQASSPFGKFAVSLRRFGKFKVIGYGKTEMEAFGIGKKAASTTLGATFRVEGLTKVPKSVPGFKTKKTKEGQLFIELPKFRLSTRGEKKEIQLYKGLKGGKKK